ncbi:MAG: PhnE/PtxC family ABC transporter permease [Spirochaetota bacterium]
MTLILGGLIVIMLLAGDFTRFDTEKGIRAVPRVLAWAATNFVPDQEAVSRLPRILDRLVDTILMAVMASVTAAVFAFPVALMGSRTTRITGFLAVTARGIASLFRNIPVAAWAMIFLLSFGQSDFTGFLALFFATFGFLTRAFMETVDEASASAVEALRATGASYLQTVAQAVVPGSLPQMLSWILFMIETNIRSATLVGILTGSGIGFLFDVYYKSLQYKSAALIVICIIVVVLAIESLSNGLRRVIL